MGHRRPERAGVDRRARPEGYRSGAPRITVAGAHPPPVAPDRARLNGTMQNLLPEPPATRLPANDEADKALADAQQTGTDDAYAAVAARFPAYSGGWAALAANALAARQSVAAYAYARTGYHRGLDALRRNGWKGHGPIPWS